MKGLRWSVFSVFDENAFWSFFTRDFGSQCAFQIAISVTENANEIEKTRQFQTFSFEGRG